MSSAYLEISGVRADSARLTVPAVGRWLLDVEYVGAALSGAVVARIGDLELKGTVHSAGTFVGSTSLRIVGGANGWGKDVPARPHHNDATVRRADVITQLATEVGETVDIGSDTTRMRPDHVRVAGPAWRALEEALAGLPWRVDFDGVTRYGARAAATLGAGVEVLDADPVRGVVTLAAPDPSAVPIGAVVSDSRLGAPLTIQEIDATITGSGARIRAWGTSGGSSRLLRALKSIVQRLTLREPYLGPRRYRVVGMRASASSVTLTRVALQIVNKSVGLPDLLLVDAWPGLAGSRAELAPGALVLVQFIDGDPEQPYVCAYSTADDPAWKPAHVVLDATETVKIGASAELVELGSGSETGYSPGAELGRVLRLGDVIAGPASLGAPLTLAPAVPGTTPIAKVKA